MRNGCNRNGAGGSPLTASTTHAMAIMLTTDSIFSTHDPRLLDQVRRLVKLEDGRITGDEVQ